MRRRPARLTEHTLETAGASPRPLACIVAHPAYCPARSAQEFSSRSHTGENSVKFPSLAFTTIDWNKVEPTIHPGETGEALWRTFEVGDLRVRRARSAVV